MGFPNIYVAYGDIFICWCFKKLVLRRFLLVKTPEFSGYRFVLAAKSDLPNLFPNIYTSTWFCPIALAAAAAA